MKLTLKQIMNLKEARCLICDHFDEIKYKIDINIKTLLCNSELNEERRQNLNDIRHSIGEN